MIIFNCSAQAAKFFDKNPDSESVKIIAPTYDGVRLDSEHLTADNVNDDKDPQCDSDSDWGSDWNAEPMQWQIDIKHDSKHITKQDSAKQYLVCCETESKFSLYFDCEQVTSASQFVSLFFSTWAQTQKGYSERYLIPISIKIWSLSESLAVMRQGNE
ncbi:MULTISPECIES: hypothetical protein [unclassified Shewanella]|uniref:hypothetical protein n=1 Tax=unclassified Shewanella TaxID=196818 RepID=UPI001BBA8D12|nr:MULTISPECIES: hypothetical protein [unclassified Shewanella]GIU07199.1 hypothetical protein TUM4444_06330 [Shewanella sp. MBTL60-112-B1]GIU35579.1 hypothetical protein TUM4445_25570 [Shewanella sp. MBTL60-112-B2]